MIDVEILFEITICTRTSLTLIPFIVPSSLNTVLLNTCETQKKRKEGKTWERQREKVIRWSLQSLNATCSRHKEGRLVIEWLHSEVWNQDLTLKQLSFTWINDQSCKRWRSYPNFFEDLGGRGVREYLFFSGPVFCMSLSSLSHCFTLS